MPSKKDENGDKDLGEISVLFFHASSWQLLYMWILSAKQKPSSLKGNVCY